MFADVLRNRKFSYLWLALRVWLGYQWLVAGIEKLEKPAWVGGQAGAAIKGFWMKSAGLGVGTDGALLPPTAKYEWYRAFLKLLVDSNSQVWFSYLIVVGEIAVGIALIFGAFTVLAALGGAVMNLNYMLAGVASVNPVFYTAAILILLAGSNSWHWGLDRVLLPRLGTLRRRLAHATSGIF